MTTQRLLGGERGQPRLHLLGDADDVDLAAAAGRAGDHIRFKAAQVERRENALGHLDLVYRIARDGHADRVADALGEQGPDADGGLDYTFVMKAGGCDAKMQRVIA